MKLRTIMLVGCMLVVPAWAMFSHAVPTELRKAVRDLVMSARVAPAGPSAAAAGPAMTATGQPVTLAAAGGTNPLTDATSLPAAPIAAAAPVAAGAPPVAAGSRPGATGPKPVIAGSTLDANAPQQPPAIVSQLADRTRHVRDQQARELQAIEAQLAQVGAIGFDCQPLAGGEGLHGCSCRVPVDASGQLQRVFQAAGHDPLTAALALRDQVTAWKDRAARMAEPAPAPATGSLPAAVAPGVGTAVMPYAGDRFR